MLIMAFTHHYLLSHSQVEEEIDANFSLILTNQKNPNLNREKNMTIATI